jgi:putative phosphonate metabolism protein
MGSRYAIYYTPHPDSALWHFGSRVLGYDAYLVADMDQPRLDGLSAVETRAATAAPRRYGFHATLKAPFDLAEDHDTDHLLVACHAFARQNSTIILSGLKVKTLGTFLALTAKEHSPALDALAAKAVGAFDPFRAPLADEERDRRLQAGLSRRQRQHLEKWGYPYVFEDYRFHMTLTGALDEPRRSHVRMALEQGYAEHCGDDPVEIDAIALCMEDGRSGRFAVIDRFPLAD